MMTRSSLGFLLAGFFLLLPGVVQSQWAVSPHVVVSIPRHDFANVGKNGGGFGVKVERFRDRGRNGFGARGDFAFLSFGRKTSVVVDSFGFPIPIESRNEGFRLTFGPQYRLGGRSLKIFAAATGGLYFYRTNITAQFSTISGTQFFQDSQGNNWALGWNIGGGIQYDIGLGPWLDISFEYQTIYDLPASVEEDAEADVAIPDINANEFTIKFGVIFFLKK